MSSGPSRMKEKPRSASSSCIDETPRSRATPSRRALADSPPACWRSGAVTRRKRPVAAREPAKAGGGRIAVEGDHVRAGVEEGAAVAAGAEGAVDHQLAGAGARASTTSASRTGVCGASRHAAAPGAGRALLRAQVGQALAGDVALARAMGLEGVARPDLEAVAADRPPPPSRSGRTARTGSRAR